MKISAHKSGSALILTMFIMAGMLIVALSGAYVVFLGIKAGGIQAQSTKAYYAAETGAERLLWELRQNSYSYEDEPGTLIFQGDLVGESRYDVYFIDFPPLVFRAIGEYQNSRRSVEIRI
ncbi:MAG: hypothetical protein WC719_03630 [Patescibacteria group bacterium]|jgi:hypothetical protein